VSHLLRALETFRAQGIEFVSFSEQLDTSTPAGKMVFTVLGAVAELERGLIVERVKAGLRNAQSQGQTARAPQEGPGYEADCQAARTGRWLEANRRRDGVGVGTVYRAALEGSETQQKVF
jgi:DNA invertase Pin-like site-specific DNA recombinase